MVKKRFRQYSTTAITHRILWSFLILIGIGSVLLAAPISSASDVPAPYVDALFTAVTSVCVTGLVTVTTATTWSFFGQLVILLLIQIGGLGAVAVLSIVMIELHKKMGLNDRLLIQAAFNLNAMSGLTAFVKMVVFGTFLVEGVGALLYAFVFVPEYGLKGVWISLFTSVSAFCNAGIDLLGENSLCDYALNPIVNLTTCLLITLGGVGFVVWRDVARALRNLRAQGLRSFRNLTLHSKTVLSVSAVLLVGGSLSFFVLEYDNPLTMGNRSLGEKIMLSVFQSVATRTAGFAGTPQQNLTNAASLVSLALMFIGGSPCGTAGGVKTTALAALGASAVASVKNRKNATLFHRNISGETVARAVAVVATSFLTAFLSAVLLSTVTEADVLDVLYEAASATATVGLTRNLTSSLNVFGKWILIFTMYLGRVGPLSVAVAFPVKKGKKNVVENPTEEMIVG